MQTLPPKKMSLAGYWVVIPAYNEVSTIRDVVSRTLKQITKVIVVDDGSTDDTEEALDGLDVIVLRNPTNRGKAASLWRGFHYALEAGASGIVTLDGDGQHAPEDIPKLIAEAKRFRDHLILGVRRRSQRRAAMWRYGANRVADFWISWAAGRPIEDSQSGFRVYPATLLKTVRVEHDKARSFVFESEILMKACLAGFHITAVTIEALPRTGLRSSHFRPVLDITRITLMVARELIPRGMCPWRLYRVLIGGHSAQSEKNKTHEHSSQLGAKLPRV